MQKRVHAMFIRWVSVCIVALWGVAGLLQPTFAQDSGDLEALRQRARMEAQERIQQSNAPNVHLDSAPPSSDEGAVRDNFALPAETPCFKIRAVHLEVRENVPETTRAKGADASPFNTFHWAQDYLDHFAGQCIGKEGVNIIVRGLTAHILQKGYSTTRAVIPEQDLSTGTLKIVLVPGIIRAIRFADAGVSDSLKAAFPARPGDLLNLRDLEQGLENFKRVPTAEADVQIEPGKLLGESDIVVRYRQAFPLRVTLSADDGGSRATGRYQGGVTISYDNLWTFNDLFYVSVNHDLGGGDSGDRGTGGYTVYYSVPFGYWLLGATTNEYRYHQAVAGANQTYVYSGTSQNTDLRISRLIYRDAVRKTTLSLRGYLSTSHNFIDDTEVEVQRRRTAGWEAGLGHREFMGSATLDLNVAYRHGTGAFNAMPAPEEAFGEGTSRPGIVTTDVALNVPFTLDKQQLRYNGVLRAQWNETPLIPQDRFAIGGRYSVRGFDGENVLSSERGWLIRNDLGLTLGASGQELYLGLDYGEVGGPSSEFLLGKRLAGAVVGLRGAYKGLQYDVFVGQPVAKPHGFETAGTTAGFNVSWSL